MWWENGAVNRYIYEISKDKEEREVWSEEWTDIKLIWHIRRWFIPVCGFLYRFKAGGRGYCAGSVSEDHFQKYNIGKELWESIPYENDGKSQFSSILKIKDKICLLMRMGEIKNKMCNWY